MKKVISKDGTEIAFDKAGKGPILILVDGALCYRSFGPAKQLSALLTDQFTVFTYDRRGRGDSGNTLPYTVDREVEDIDALIKEAGGSAFVFGQSSGAALALEASARIKGIKKLALYEAPFIVDDSLPPRPKDLLENMNKLVASDRRGDAVKLFMKTVGAPSIFVLMMSFTPAWSKLKAVAHTIPYDFTILEGTGSGRPLPANRWTAATMPTLVMNGGKSPTWMQHAMKALAGVLPNATYQILAGQTHMVKSGVLAPALMKFFKD